MWKFSIIKAFKNDRVLRNDISWFLTFLFVLAIRRNEFDTVLPWLIAFSVFVAVIALRLLFVLCMLKTGSEVQGKILERQNLGKGRAKMTISFPVGEETIEKKIIVANSSDASALAQNGFAAVLFSKKHKNIVILKELYCSKL